MIKPALILIIISLLSVAKIFSQTEELKEELNYILQNGLDPGEYILEKFEIYQVILLGEDHAVKENLQFVAKIIPELYENGIYSIGMEFGAAEDQNQLDSLVSAPEFNRDVARNIMYNYNVAWPYKEYMDMYYEAWKLNRSLPDDAVKFRIFNISYQYDWTYFESPRTPENVKKVFHKGTADKFRAELIEKEYIKKDKKILLLVGTPHAFTKYESPIFRYNNDDFCDFDDQWLGNRLYRKYPDRVFNILIHQPFYNLPGKQPVQVSPANGMIEKLMVLNDDRLVGFDLYNSPLGRLKENGSYSMCYDDFTMEELFDGYIFLEPFEELEGCSIDEDFFNGKSWEEVEAQRPDPDWHGPPKDWEHLWSQIKEYVDLKKRYSGLID